MGGAIKARLGDRKTNCQRQFDDVERCQDLAILRKALYPAVRIPTTPHSLPSEFGEPLNMQRLSERCWLENMELLKRRYLPLWLSIWEWTVGGDGVVTSHSHPDKTNPLLCCLSPMTGLQFGLPP